MDRDRALLSAQRALLGAITSNVRAVALRYENEPLLRFYFDQEPSEIERDLADSAAGEMLADFPEIDDFRWEAVVAKRDAVDSLDVWIFVRHEEEAV